ncbi:MAG: c-type cytochrome domain-containing protein [Polyangiales bacterium]
MTSSFLRSLRPDRLAPCLLIIVAACAPDETQSDADDLRAQTLAPTLDAATAGDAGTPSSDAGDAGTDPCGPGKISCGATCIDAIASTAAAVQERVFGRSCGLSRSCHGGAAPQASLNLDSLDALFDRVVGKPAVEVPSLALIAPGSPEDSYVVRKMRNTHGSVGTVMPPGAALCESKIVAVEAWIRAGALR